VRVAGIDCGTNSIRLLIADVDGGTVRDVVRRMEIVRLGQGVDRTGRIADASLAPRVARPGRHAPDEQFTPGEAQPVAERN